jgi:aspartyl-tRNA(Asn)/glutamyl-tRNA(Gln) amidotransferase subunit A
MRDKIDPFVVRRILNGSKASAADYVKMRVDRRHAVALANADFAAFDALILPTLPIIAPKTTPLAQSLDLFTATNMLILRNTTQFNLLDCCAVTLPLPEAGALPVGLMLAGAHGTDLHLLDVAASIEEFLRA